MILTIPAPIAQPKTQYKLRFTDFLAALLAGLFALVLITQPASARQPMASIAIDARTGKILYSRSADARRYPASLTKIMTLYLVFEDMKAGRINLSTKLRVSKHASRRPPSKLGLKAGSTIRVRDAIGALVTKSANDVASTVAENLSGSESAFAQRMTRTARSLGMTRTTFRNASGLPDSKQVTTVRDMATLALRIQKDFPKEYRYFSMRSYKYGRRNYRNHNRLLGRTKGVDGIKTGYTRASGFNLVTSARRGKKRIVAVVVGAKSGRSRNKYMASLINRMFKTKRLTSGSHLARVAGTPPGYNAKTTTKLAAVKRPTPPLPRIKPEEKDDIGLVVASTEPSISKKVEVPPLASDLAMASLATSSLPASRPDASEAKIAFKSDLLKLQAAAPPANKTKVAVEDAQSPTELSQLIADPHLKSWNIQIGAFPTADGAQLRLEKAMKKAKTKLKGKKPFTMKFAKGDDVYYRARFSGFTRKTAKNACRALNSRGVGCFALAPKS